jgi:DNA-binding transcriptional LysR family regulator
MFSDLESVVVFVRVVETKSFAAAAKSLGVSPASVSKHVSRLEDRLGTPLLNRSTHRLNLTEGGAEFFRRCRRSLLEMRDAEAAARDVNSALNGTLRIHITPGIGQRLIEPAVIDFLRIHDDLSVALSISPENINPLDRGLDVAFRSGAADEALMRHSSLGFREFGLLRYVVCAADDYLRTHGRPMQPTDLTKHNCLILSTQASPRKWWFRGPAGDYAVAVQGHVVSNSHTAIAEAMRAGLGIARILTFDAGMDSREFESLFEDAIVPSRMIRAFYPRAEPLPAKLAVFLDFVEKWFLEVSAQRHKQNTEIPNEKRRSGRPARAR